MVDFFSTKVNKRVNIPRNKVCGTRYANSYNKLGYSNAVRAGKDNGVVNQSVSRFATCDEVNNVTPCEGNQNWLNVNKRVNFDKAKVGKTADLKRPKSVVKTITDTRYLAEYKNSRRGLGNRRITRPANALRSPPISRLVTDYDKMRALDVELYGKQVRISDQTINKIMYIDVPDTSDIEWIKERTRRKALGETDEQLRADPPLGRPQRTLKRKINLASPFITPQQNLAILKARVENGMTENQEDLAELGQSVFKTLLGIQSGDISTDRMKDVISFIQLLELSGPPEIQGLYARYDLAGYRLNRHKLLLYMLANIPNGRTYQDMITITPVEGSRQNVSILDFDKNVMHEEASKHIDFVLELPSMMVTIVKKKQPKKETVRRPEPPTEQGPGEPGPGPGPGPGGPGPGPVLGQREEVLEELPESAPAGGPSEEILAEMLAEEPFAELQKQKYLKIESYAGELKQDLRTNYMPFQLVDEPIFMVEQSTKTVQEAIKMLTPLSSEQIVQAYGIIDKWIKNAKAKVDSTDLLDVNGQLISPLRKQYEDIPYNFNELKLNILEKLRFMLNLFTPSLQVETEVNPKSDGEVGGLFVKRFRNNENVKLTPKQKEDIYEQAKKLMEEASGETENYKSENAKQLIINYTSGQILTELEEHSIIREVGKAKEETFGLLPQFQEQVKGLFAGEQEGTTSSGTRLTQLKETHSSLSEELKRQRGEREETESVAPSVAPSVASTVMSGLMKPEEIEQLQKKAKELKLTSLSNMTDAKAFDLIKYGPVVSRLSSTEGHETDMTPGRWEAQKTILEAYHEFRTTPKNKFEFGDKEYKRPSHILHISDKKKHSQFIQKWIGSEKFGKDRLSKIKDSPPGSGMKGYGCGYTPSRSLKQQLNKLRAMRY